MSDEAAVAGLGHGNPVGVLGRSRDVVQDCPRLRVDDDHAVSGVALFYGCKEQCCGLVVLHAVRGDEGVDVDDVG